MITKDQKKKIIEDIKDKLLKQKTILFFDYSGLKVTKFQDLRGQFREDGIECQVAKKSLIDLAFQKAKIDIVKVRELPGQVAIAFGYDDEIQPARILHKFSKENEELEIVGGVVEGVYLDKEGIIGLAMLPSKQELLGKLVGSISSPLSDLMNALEGNLRKLLFVLSNCNA